MKELSNIKGQSLLEILLTLSLMALIFPTLFFLFNRAIIMGIQGEGEIRALELLENALEKTRLEGATDFYSVKNSTETIDNYLVERFVEDINNNEKKIKIQVSGNIPQNKVFSIVTILTNWRNLSQSLGGSSGGSGGSGPSGDWQNPTTLSSIDLGPGNNGTDVLVKNKTVFITAVAAEKRKPDLFLIDVTNPSSPFIKSKIDTGYGANSLALSDSYVYLAHNRGNNQLQIVDLRDESNPILISQTSLFNNNSEALSIFYYNNYVFIGSKTSNGPEFQIFNVSNPNNPTLVSTLEIAGDVNDIFVLGNIAYLATNKSGNELILVDITNINNPQIIKTKSLAQTALSVFPYGQEKILVGTTNGVFILDANNLSLVSYFDAGGPVNDIYAKGYLAFLATANPNQELEIVNISNWTQPYLYSSFNFPQVATGIDYLNNLLFVSVRSNDALRIITSR